MIGAKNNTNSSQGFTIVELLVVIVVIGILAVVTIIGYTGVTQRAAAAALEADLKTASTQLELYKAENGEYPAEGSATVIDLPASDDTTYQYSLISDQYYLSATSPSAGLTAYHISSTTGSIIAGVWENHTPPVGTPLTWKQVSSASYGLMHMCGIASDSNAYCWGYNGNGRLGNNSTTQSLIPVAVSKSGVLAGKTIKSISVGYSHTCAIASDDLAYCWGWNASGQLGDNSTTTRLVPVAVNTSGVLSGKTIKSISAANNHTCVIASDDNAYCWGQGTSGNLGNNSTSNSLVPVAVYTSGVLSGKTIKSISARGLHTCVIASNDNAYCWGYNGNGRLGNNSTTDSSVPVAVNTAGVLSGKTIKSIALGGDDSCVIASDDKVYCWGYNGSGQLGDGTTSPRLVPVAVSTAGVLSGKSISYISAGGTQTCAVDSAGLAYCWGVNSSGQLGNNSTTNSYVPVAVNTAGLLSGKTITSMTSGSYASCAITSDKNVVCWGSNGNGQLGNNSTTNSLVATDLYQLTVQ